MCSILLVYLRFSVNKRQSGWMLIETKWLSAMLHHIT
jgi:hypothetical protein